MTASIDDVLADRARWTVVHGDALEVLKGMPACSVDSCVVDPPAGIAFMSKDWDEDKGGRDEWIAWLTEIMREALRVLKPGAHAIVWALPRTSHWTATAIENAGFEIRDKITHLFGSGFPKSLNVSSAVDELMFSRWLAANQDHASWWRMCALLERWVNQLPKEEREAEWLARLEFIREIVRDAWGFRREVVHTYTASGSAAVPASEKGGTYVAGFDSRGAEPIELSVTRGATPEAREWDGWGTALKPAAEDWIVARKPLAGTIAANVLKHGTGALNVDACRVSTDWNEPDRPDSWKRSGNSDKPDAEKIAAPAGNGIECHPGGRWPPNVVFTHHPECRKIKAKSRPPTEMMGFRERLEAASNADAHGKDTIAYECVESCPVRRLDEQSGELKSGALKPYARVSSDYYSGAWPDSQTLRDADAGTASRFFHQFEWQPDLDEVAPFYYVAKASRSEREAGCDALPSKSGAEATGSKEGQARLKSPRTGANRSADAVRNVHATVKNVGLMRHFVRLATPKNGVCLDFTCGSGSTGVACVLEDKRFIGIELNDTEKEPYVRIARARIGYHARSGVQLSLLEFGT